MRGSTERLEHEDRFVEVWLDQCVLGHPPILDSAFTVDQKHGAFREPSMTSPLDVLDSIAVRHLRVPVGKHRKIRLKNLGECQLREGCSHRNGNRFGTE